MHFKNPIVLTKDTPILHNLLQSLGQASISTNKKYQKGYLEDLGKKSISKYKSTGRGILRSNINWAQKNRINYFCT